MKDYFKSDKLLKIAFLAGLAAILLVFVSGTGKSEDNASIQNIYEQKLFTILTHMDGVSNENPPEILIKVDKDDKTVLGVVVVSESASDPIVKERMIIAVSKALDVSPARICITI